MSGLPGERPIRVGTWAVWLFGVLMAAGVIYEMEMRTQMQLVVEGLCEVELRAGKELGIERLHEMVTLAEKGLGVEWWHEMVRTAAIQFEMSEIEEAGPVLGLLLEARMVAFQMLE